MTKTTCIFLLAVLGLIASCRVLAQSSTQGALAGTVLDATGAAIPSAAVTVRNDGTNAVVKLASDGSGNFNVPLLEPGRYTVSVTAPGFGEYRATGVIIQVGQSSALTAHLQLGGASATVSVTAEAPVMNYESPDFSSNLNQHELQNLPVNNRRWSSLALMTPGVVSDASGFGLISVRGISVLLNNILIDGADDNSAYWSEERGRTREAYSTSGAAVQEFAVNSGVYAAEYGRAAGGVLNSVTKSGTNQIHGQAYFYDRESNWNALNEQTTLTSLNTSTNTYVSKPFKPEDIRKIYGFTVGGPIFKEKLFWIYTYDQHSRIFPMAGVPSNPGSFFALPDSSLPSGASCNVATGYLSGAPSGTNALDAQTCTLAARLGYGSYSNGVTAYDNGISALNTAFGIVPRSGYQEINTPKLDWQVNPKEHLSLLAHRLRWDSPGGVQTTATSAYALDAAGNDYVKLDYGVAKLSSMISTNISNELLYQYSRELEDENASAPTAYSKNYLQAANGNIPQVSLDTSIGGYLGQTYYEFRPAYPSEHKWQLGDVLYYEHGKHNLKFGADLLHNDDLVKTTNYYEGNFTYSTNIANFLADVYSEGKTTGVCDVNQLAAATANVTTGTGAALGAYPCYNSLLQDYGPSSVDIATMDYDLFAQDNWKLTPRLTLQLGVRYDYEALPSPFSSLTAASGSYAPFNGVTNHPSDKNNVGPRVGFSFDAFGKGKTVLRGGYGIFFGRITNGNLRTVLQQTGSPLSQSGTTVSQKTGLSSEPIFPNIIPSASLTSSSAKPTAYFMSPNLQNPQIHEFDLQVQQNLGHGTVFQASYLGALGRELPNFLDVNLNPTTQNVNITIVDSTGKGPIASGTVITVPTFTSYGNTALLGPSAVNFQAVTEFTSNVNSNYNALAIEALNRSLHSIQFDVNYTWSHALDYNQNAYSGGNVNSWYNPYGNARANYANSFYDVPNRMVATALYNFPNAKITNWASYLTNHWSLNNSFQIQSGLPFATGGSSPTSGMLSGSNSSSAVSSYWNGNGGVDFLPQLGHYSYREHRDIVDDVRLEKEIRFMDRYNLQLFAQAFNIANHQNETQPYNLLYKLTSTGALTGNATYQSTFGQVQYTNNSGFAYSPRQIEISMRLEF